jgi:hypothetical protein
MREEAVALLSLVHRDHVPVRHRVGLLSVARSPLVLLVQCTFPMEEENLYQYIFNWSGSEMMIQSSK